MGKKATAWVLGLLFATSCSDEDSMPPVRPVVLDFGSEGYGEGAALTGGGDIPSPAVPATPSGGGAVELRTPPEPVELKREHLRIACSPSAEKLIAEPLEPLFEKNHSGSGIAFSRLRDTDRNCVEHVLMGQADVALIAVELSASEKAKGLAQQVVGYRIAVPVVHPRNPIRSLDPRSLKKIIEGETTSWEKVGWQDLFIQPVSLAPNGRSDGPEALLRMRDKALNTAVFARSLERLLSYVANERSAIGLVTLTSIQGDRNARIMEIDHVLPTREAYLRGPWPLGCTFRVISRRKQGRAIQTYFSFLESEEARRILQRQITLP